jgi:hypothetical protein
VNIAVRFLTLVLRADNSNRFFGIEIDWMLAAQMDNPAAD